MNEQWLPIVGFEGLYEVSDQGRVRSVDRVTTGRWGNQVRKGVELKSFHDKDGYLRVNLWRSGACTQVFIHRLVLEAFVGMCPCGSQTLHGDGVRSNNLLTNLCWGTPKENSFDRKRHGRGPNGERNPKAKLSPREVRSIRSDGRIQRVIAKDFGVDQTTISSIKRQQTWAAIND